MSVDTEHFLVLRLNDWFKLAILGAEGQTNKDIPCIIWQMLETYQVTFKNYSFGKKVALWKVREKKI